VERKRWVAGVLAILHPNYAAAPGLDPFVARVLWWLAEKQAIGLFILSKWEREHTESEEVRLCNMGNKDMGYAIWNMLYEEMERVVERVFVVLLVLADVVGDQDASAIVHAIT
jgi:hypothetical protein